MKITKTRIQLPTHTTSPRGRAYALRQEVHLAQLVGLGRNERHEVGIITRKRTDTHVQCERRYVQLKHVPGFLWTSWTWHPSGSAHKAAKFS